MNRSAKALTCLFALVLFAAVVLPSLPRGPLPSGRQDEWYNVVRSLRALYEGLDPSYFIHPALYYETLATVFGAQRSALQWAGSVDAAHPYLSRFVFDDVGFLNLARDVSAAFGALATIASSLLAGELGGPWAALLAGAATATLPLLASLSGSIRVDTAYLFLFLAAWLAALRFQRTAKRSDLALAGVAVGAAAAANYPGALLLLPLAARLSRRPEPELDREIGLALGAAAAAFLALNPYFILHHELFARWFTFQLRAAVQPHPFAPEPSPWSYTAVLAGQGPAFVVLVLLGAATAFFGDKETRAVARFGCLYFAAFSLLRSQYDRFILPAFVLLIVSGSAFLATLPWRDLVWKRLAPAAAALAFIAAWAVRPRQRLPPVEDYRLAMLRRVWATVPDGATLIYESDTLPALQSAMDEAGEGRFQKELGTAFAAVYPAGGRTFLKAQFIGSVEGYDLSRLSDGKAYFLDSTKNRAYLRAHRGLYPGPNEFYDALDGRCRLLENIRGEDEALELCRIDEPGG